jgi:integrase
MPATKTKNPAMVGIATRTDAGGKTQYRGTAYDPLAKRHARGSWTYSKAAAKSWRVDALAKIQAGKLSAARAPTVAAAADRFIEEAEAGEFRQSGGRKFKPSTLRGYRGHLRQQVVERFGPTAVNRLDRKDVQRWVDTMTRDRAPGTVRSHFSALRALMIFSTYRGWTMDDPTTGVRLPTGEKERDRIATPEEAALLVTALEMRDRAALGLSVYAGLRRAEVLGIDVDRVDFRGGWIHIDRAWEPEERCWILPKNNKPRKVPMIGRARALLLDHIQWMESPTGLLFPSHHRDDWPVDPSQLLRRLKKQWEGAGLEPLTFHPARHTYASMCIHAGLNIKTLSTYMGHANTAITLDRYGHLMPGAEREAVALMDEYLAA